MKMTCVLRPQVSEQSGFTLVEVLVALVILTFAISMLGQTMGGAVNAFSWMESKSQAYVVASNKMVEMQVYFKWPKTGKQDERVSAFGTEWELETQVSPGPYPDTRKVTINVGPVTDFGEEFNSWYELKGLLGKPLEKKDVTQ